MRGDAFLLLLKNAAQAFCTSDHYRKKVTQLRAFTPYDINLRKSETISRMKHKAKIYTARKNRHEDQPLLNKSTAVAPLRPACSNEPGSGGPITSKTIGNRTRRPKAKIYPTMPTFCFSSRTLDPLKKSMSFDSRHASGVIAINAHRIPVPTGGYNRKYEIDS